jgi:hypothetical protein
MTDARHQLGTTPTPDLFGGSPAARHSNSSTREGLASRRNPADPTVRKIYAAYDLSNDTDTVGKAFLELLRAHHALGRRNVEQLAVSIQTLATAQTAAEFATLQKRLLAKSLADAVRDGAVIRELTTTAFSTAFEPMSGKVGELRGGAERQE